MRQRKAAFLAAGILYLGAVCATMASEPPLPDDPQWRMLVPPTSALGNSSLIGAIEGSLYARNTSVSPNVYFHSPDGVYWMEIPGARDGQTGRTGERLYFQSLSDSAGTVYHAFGLLLYRENAEGEWEIIPENQLWLRVQTAMIGDRLIRVGEVVDGDPAQTVAAISTPDGGWEEATLGTVDLGFSARLLRSPSGLVYTGQDQYWSSPDGVSWTAHPIPELIRDVPTSAITGTGPYMVNYSGSVGSAVNGDLRFVAVFARSEDGLTWVDASTPTMFVQTNFSFIPPWFQKISFTVVDGSPKTANNLSLDGLTWQQWTPQGTAVASIADFETHRFGYNWNTIYIFDKSPPLPAPAVVAEDGTDGIVIRWNEIPEAAYYVVIGKTRTFQTFTTEAFVPHAFQSKYETMTSVSARVVAVSAQGQPGLISTAAQAAAINGGLPEAQEPINLRIDSSSVGFSWFNFRWQAVGGTAIHEVAWSTQADGSGRQIFGRVQDNSLQLPLKDLPVCTEIHLWVRGVSGSSSSAWAGPLPFLPPDNGLPCPPSDLTASVPAGNASIVFNWQHVPYATDYEITRERGWPDSPYLTRAGSTNNSVFTDQQAFFDTTYRYRIRSRMVRPIVGPIFSRWSDPILVSRSPTELESLTLQVLGWESLGDGRFSSADFGQFWIIDENSDWIGLDSGSHILLHAVDERLNYLMFLPRPLSGWALTPVGRWPYVWSPSSRSWFWIAPGGDWAWDFKRRRWVTDPTTGS